MNWFQKEHPQKVTLKTFTVLVGKPPTKSKRIRMAFTLDLTAGEVKGCPEWMQEARNFTMRTLQTVTEDHSASGYNVSFGDPNLFKDTPVEAPKSDLRKFVMFSAGDSEQPSTLLSFVMYASFSTDLNRWLGQMAGETFTATFEAAVEEEDDSGDLVMTSPEADEPEDDEDDASEDEDYETSRAEACKPEHDAEFVAEKPTRGRPKRVTEPLKPPTEASVAAATKALTLM